MSIYIIDNGGSYSDHEIIFLETEYPISVVELTIDLVWRKRGNDGYKIVGVADRIAWLTTEHELAESTAKICDVLSPSDLVVRGKDGEPKPQNEALKLPDDLLRAVIDHARAENRGNLEIQAAKHNEYLQQISEALGLGTGEEPSQ